METNYTNLLANSNGDVAFGLTQKYRMFAITKVAADALTKKNKQFIDWSDFTHDKIMHKINCYKGDFIIAMPSDGEDEKSLKVASNLEVPFTWLFEFLFAPPKDHKVYDYFSKIFANEYCKKIWVATDQAKQYLTGLVSSNNSDYAQSLRIAQKIELFPHPAIVKGNIFNHIKSEGNLSLGDIAKKIDSTTTNFNVDLKSILDSLCNESLVQYNEHNKSYSIQNVSEKLGLWYFSATSQKRKIDMEAISQIIENKKVSEMIFDIHPATERNIVKLSRYIISLLWLLPSNFSYKVCVSEKNKFFVKTTISLLYPFFQLLDTSFIPLYCLLLPICRRNFYSYMLSFITFYFAVFIHNTRYDRMLLKSVRGKEQLRAECISSSVTSHLLAMMSCAGKEVYSGESENFLPKDVASTFKFANK